MKIYMWSADLYCGPCGEAIAATLPDPDAWEREHPDSNSYPVAYDSSEGESDTPDHCGQCDLFLERGLTEEGVRYVRDYMDTLDGDTDITLLWGEFYGIAKATEECIRLEDLVPGCQCRCGCHDGQSVALDYDPDCASCCPKATEKEVAR